MPKYLIQASYTTEGARGLLKEGGSARRAAAEELIRSVDGKMEAFYFAYGDSDAYVIADFPDSIAASAASLAINTSGSVQVRTIVLITPEEVDKAIKKAARYRAPGR